MTTIHFRRRGAVDILAILAGYAAVATIALIVLLAQQFGGQLSTQVVPPEESPTASEPPLPYGEATPTPPSPYGEASPSPVASASPAASVSPSPEGSPTVSAPPSPYGVASPSPSPTVPETPPLPYGGASPSPSCSCDGVVCSLDQYCDFSNNCQCSLKDPVCTGGDVLCLGLTVGDFCPQGGPIVGNCERVPSLPGSTSSNSACECVPGAVGESHAPTPTPTNGDTNLTNADNTATPAICPTSFIQQGDEWIRQQSHLKGYVTKALEGTSYERLRTQDLSGTMNLEIREQEGDVDYIDEFSLLSLSHPNDTTAYLDPTGNAYLSSGTSQTVTPAVTATGNREVRDVATNGAQGIVLKAAVTASIQTGFAVARSAAALACTPGIYDLIDQVPKDVFTALQRERLGVEVYAKVQDAWQHLTVEHPLFLEDDTVFLPLPAGTTAVRLSNPVGHYIFQPITLLDRVVPLTTPATVIPPDNPTLTSADGQYQIVDGDSPVRLSFELPTAASGMSQTVYVQATGYYHYFEDLLEECGHRTSHQIPCSSI